MCTPVPLCMYTCTWFQVLVQVCTTCRHVSMAAILFFAFMLFSISSIKSDLCIGGVSREVVVRFPVPWVLHIVNYLLTYQFVAGASDLKLMDYHTLYSLCGYLHFAHYTLD